MGIKAKEALLQYSSAVILENYKVALSGGGGEGGTSNQKPHQNQNLTTSSLLVIPPVCADITNHQNICIIQLLIVNNPL